MQILKSRKLEIIIMGSLILILGFSAYTRNKVWRSVKTLTWDSVVKSPQKVRPHINYGAYLMQAGRLEEAIFEMEEALRLDPESKEAHINLGAIYAAQGKLDESGKHLFEALRIDPDCAATHSNIGVVMVKKGSLKEALFHFEEAVKLKPDFEEAKQNLALIKQALGKR